MAAERKFELRPIRTSDKFAHISTGDAKFTVLKTFLLEHAHDYEQNRFARTYGFYGEDDKIAAYITLVCSEVDLGDDASLHPGDGTDEEKKRRYPYTTYPAIKIARLLVDRRYRDADLGTQLVWFAYGVGVDGICPRVGCRFLVVDSKQDSIRFYQKCGFSLLDTPENIGLEHPVMFVDLMAADPRIETADSPAGSAEVVEASE